MQSRALFASCLLFLFASACGGSPDSALPETPEETVASTSEALTLPDYDRSGCLGPGCRGGLTDGEFEYVVVGSGAGGGPLAARLAQQGHRVLLLEAGGDPGDKLTYQIPAWHGLASEDPEMRWDYFVDHYDDPQRAAKDDKLVRDARGNARGILYPRGSALGGSTSMNAMIAVAPHASDWEHIAGVLGNEDPSGSFHAPAMRRYFERAENSHYMPNGSPGHGHSGWMYTGAYLDNFFDYVRGAVDLKLSRAIAATVLQSGRELGGDRPFDFLRDFGALSGYVGTDLNSADPERDGREGAFRLPQQGKNGKRVGVREFVLDTIAAGYPLTLKTHALVTHVDFDRSGAEPRAKGVTWLDGEHLYSASPLTDPRSGSPTRGTSRSIAVTGEVVLSAGAFNTPQLLMLSGVGARADLARFGIDTVVDAPGVGRNLQDRYEVGVVGEMSSVFGSKFALLKNCSFDPDASPLELSVKDPCYLLWKLGLGVYTINGSVVGVVKKSRPELTDPDLFIFGVPGHFKGYWPGYAKRAVADRTQFTWAVLKAHTNNTAGTVTLSGTDPRVPPHVAFRYFEEGGRADLDALVEGVRIARSMVDKTKRLGPPTDDFREVYPGKEVASREQVSRFIQDNAWGHHACCTTKIGAATDRYAVLDGRFRVRGTRGLRVVDASVFPKIPGYFLAVPTYMISEKAADVLHQDSLTP